MMHGRLDPSPDEPGPAGRLITLMTRRRTIHRTLMIVLLIALGPLALLAAAQGLARLSRDARNANISLAETVSDRTVPDRNRLLRLQPMVELLALQAGPALSSVEACEAVHKAATAGLPSYATLAVADRSGRIGCSSEAGWVGKPLPPDGVSAGEGLGLTGSVLLIGPQFAHPQPGDIRVAAVISLDGLAAAIEPPQRNKGAVTLIADGHGQPLGGELPAGLSLADAVATPATPLAVTDGGGTEWVVVGALLRPADTPDDSVFLLFARPRIGAFGKDWWFFASSFAIPLMALLLASIAIWMGTNHSILRWVTELRQVTGLISEGNYRLSAERFEDAPTEVRQLAADVQRMARTIAERDRTLTEALGRQKGLTLELNHRVRNNLQLVSSYLTLQGADAGREKDGDGAEPGPFAQLRLRVSALALVHRLLYIHYDRPALRADVLLTELADLLQRDFGIGETAVQSPPTAVAIDAAVPMALAVVEAATWLQGLGGEASELLALHFEAADGDARLTVRTGPVPGVSIGDTPRLLGAFARQLGGELSLFSGDDTPAVLQIRFPSANLDREFHASIGNNSTN